MQVHTGILGGHRSANKTMSALKRLVWWQTMNTDVETWCARCHTCQRFRKVAQRQEAPSVVPIEAECWERVMIDIEGPSTPADLDSCIYLMAYICQVYHGILSEKTLPDCRPPRWPSTPKKNCAGIPWMFKRSAQHQAAQPPS